MDIGPPPPSTTTTPGVIPFAETTLKLWGDPVSGQVNDWIYVTSDNIHQLVFSMAPRAWFRHSDRYTVITEADELYYVLSGTLVLANPETGEAQRLKTGESLWFRGDTWHHGFSQGSEELRVLEFFAPGPALAMTPEYYASKANLTSFRYHDDSWLGRWPDAALEARSRSTLRKVLPNEVLWRVEGTEREVVVGILMSTDKLTVAEVALLPGQTTDPRTHGGDLSLYVLEGRLNVALPHSGGQVDWYQVEPGDGFFIPAEVPHQYFNISAGNVKFIFGVAPRYVSSQATDSVGLSSG